MKPNIKKNIPTAERHIPELEWIERLAKLMDSSITVPGTKFKFGLDPLIGLIPVAGNAFTFIVSGLLVLVMSRHGASGKVVVLMALNAMLDALVGSVPILGNIIDFFYKANNTNVELLKKHYQEGKYQGSGKGLLVVIALVFIAFLGLLIYGLWELTAFLIGLFAGGAGTM